MKLIMILAGYIAAVAMAVWLFAGPSYAGPQCMGRADAMAMMYRVYGQSLVGEGAMPNGIHLVIFANPITRTFTATYSNGPLLCLIGQGTEWQSTVALPVGTPA